MNQSSRLRVCGGAAVLLIGSLAGGVSAAEATVAAAKAAAPAAPVSARAECQPSKKATPGISEDIVDELREASTLLGNKQSDAAIAKLLKIADKGEPYDKAVVNFNIGIGYTEKNDYRNAATAFAKALSFNALPAAQAEQLRYNLGQLQIATQQHDAGIATLQQYIAEACGAISPDAHMFLASALAERKRFPEAMQQIDAAIAKVPEPKESWIQFRLGLQYEQKDFKASAESLLQLIAMSPGKADYWKQLAGVLLQMNDETQATAVMALAERQGMLKTPDDVRNLYNTYMVLGEPMKAAELMQSAIAAGVLGEDEKTLESVSTAWINARETVKAEATLKQLAAMSDRGEYYFRLGAMYGDSERWKESLEMLAKAIDKGGLKKPGEAWFRVAVAHYGSNDVKAAIGALQKSVGYDDTRSQAADWLRTLTAQPLPTAAVAPAGSSTVASVAPAS